MVTPAADKAKGVGVMTAVMAKVVAAATKEAIIMAVVLHLVVAVPCEEGPEAAVAMEAAANDLLLIR